MTTTIADLRKILRAKCRVHVPVLVPGDVRHVQAIKADVLYQIEMAAPESAAPWYVARRSETDVYLDVQDERTTD